ncbi:MAG: aromatic amino acid lyase, partial [Terriglobia bacterium]
LALRKIHHTGNFAGFYVALGLDILKLAMFNVADLLHAVKARLLNERYNRGLGASLAGRHPGLNSGLKGIDIATTDIFGKICFLAAPMSIHRRGTESYNQDLVSFGFGAAIYALELNEEFRRLLAAVLLVLAQAVDRRVGDTGGAGAALAPRTRELYEQVRSQVSFLDEDRPLHDDLEAIVEMIRAREIAAA